MSGNSYLLLAGRAQRPGPVCACDVCHRCIWSTSKAAKTTLRTIGVSFYRFGRGLIWWWSTARTAATANQRWRHSSRRRPGVPEIRRTKLCESWKIPLVAGSALLSLQQAANAPRNSPPGGDSVQRNGSTYRFQLPLGHGAHNGHGQSALATFVTAAACSMSRRTNKIFFVMISFSLFLLSSRD